MSVNEKKNIINIVDNALCCACGICASVCPAKAIIMVRNHANFLKAYVENNRCLNCGKCINYCPSVSNNVEYLLRLQDGKWSNGKNVLKGFIGYSYDSDVRKKGQSGGVTSSLLMHLIDKRYVKGALVNRFDIRTQQADVFFATDSREIISAAGSYYVQSATLKNIDYYDDNVAVVVTGCQSEALMLRYKQTGRRPKLIIGLACAGNYSLDYMYDLADFEHISHNIQEFRFRDKRINGWPGDVYIDMGEKIIKKSILERVELKSCYNSYRCMQCFDINNIFADIVVGDPWCFRKEYDKEELKNGYTVVVARTLIGLEAIENAENDGYVILEKKIPEMFFNHNSYVAGGAYKAKYAMDMCVEEGLPTIYNDECKEIIYSDLLGSKNKKNNRTKILQDIKHSYALYNANSRGMVNKLNCKVKKRLARKKIMNLPMNLVIECLIKIRNIVKATYIKFIR